MEMLQLPSPLLHLSVWPLTPQKKVSFYIKLEFPIFQLVFILSSLHGALLSHIWLHVLCTVPWGSYRQEKDPPKISLQRLYETCSLIFSLWAMCSGLPDHQGGLVPRCQIFRVSIITSFTIYFNLFSEHSIWKLCTPNKFSLPRKTSF